MDGFPLWMLVLQIKNSPHSASWEEGHLLIYAAGATNKALSEIQWMSLKGSIQKKYKCLINIHRDM